MKRRVKWLVLASVIAAFVSQAQAQEAYSANAIGVIRKTIPAGGQILLSIPLDLEGMDDATASIAFNDLPFLSKFPTKSTANIWDTQNNCWISGAKKISGKWDGPITNCNLHAGQALFLQNGSSSADLEIVFSGSVPDDDTIPLNLATANQLQLMSNPYPVPYKFTETALASNAVNGSTVNFWVIDTSKPAKGRFVSGKKGLTGVWSTDIADYVVLPGEGFYFTQGNKATAGQQWVVGKPYEWP